MVPSYMNMISCPVCGGNTLVNGKRQLAEHKVKGQICYGSYMPSSEPKFLDPPKPTLQNTWSNTYGNGHRWNVDSPNYHSSSSGSAIYYGDSSQIPEVPVVPVVQEIDLNLYGGNDAPEVVV